MIEVTEKVYKDILGVPDDVRMLGMFPIGYPKEDVQNYTEDDYDENIVRREKW